MDLMLLLRVTYVGLAITYVLSCFHYK